jgi:branched-chain amino acid transport system ATP-binding protein
VALLEVEGMSKRFGGIEALSSLSLAVDESEAVGVIGPNGAGKTTLFDCVFGLLRPDTGSITFDGVRIDRAPTFRRARLGMGRTFQRLELFTGMTPRQHVFVTQSTLAGRSHLWKDLAGAGSPTTEDRRQADEVLELVGLTDVADVPVEALGLATGRLVELARALAARPRLLLLDEPSSGLEGGETSAVVAILARVRSERRTAIVLVEHDVDMVSEVAQRLVVLDFGRLIADGPVDQVLADAGVRRAYLGEGKADT